MIRLDAFGYVTKKPGTKCFFEVSPAQEPSQPVTDLSRSAAVPLRAVLGLQEPEVWDFLQGVDKLTDEYGTRSAGCWALSCGCAAGAAC